MVEYSVVKNTKKNTNNWAQVLKEYRSLVNLDYDVTTILEITQLEHELIQFFLGLRHKDMKPYSPKSIYNCYCAIACYLKDNSLMYPRPNLFDETCYGTLLKSSHILNHDELRDDSPQALTKRVYFWLCLLCGFHGGIKNLDNVGRKCGIPLDQNGKFTPIADILYYMNKHPSGFLVQEFFLRIAPRKDNLYSIWFVNSALGWHSHENMIHEICNVTGISMQLRKITNHSLRRTAIQILTELNVTADRIMPFSGHFTLNVNSDNKEEYDSKEESHNYNNKNKKDNNSVKEKKRIPLASLPSNTESDIYIPKRSASPELQKSHNEDSDKTLNNCSIPQININNCKKY
ncbi:hypothetical protein C2G38_2159545 [Gigaspora rosea]|uniref:Tyr recombinase domain-containing protein n=1 Tax=Gigaspora rosea TaxID=44941 RepID=A0A397W3E3_9GLOM|nr:hypothetical protein C2G38_2159545 [Gigaspora rosea]